MLGLVALASITWIPAIALPETSLSAAWATRCYRCRLLICGHATFRLLVTNAPRTSVSSFLLEAFVCGVPSTCGTLHTTIGGYGLVGEVRSGIVMGAGTCLWNCSYGQSLSTALKFVRYLLSIRAKTRITAVSLSLVRVSANGARLLERALATARLGATAIVSPSHGAREQSADERFRLRAFVGAITMQVMHETALRSRERR
jgi:hypothetical protein